MLRTSDLDYDLPERLIATRPAEPRDSARLLVVRRSDPRRRRHLRVHDLPSLLTRGDVLVYNTTSVLPARIFARRETGGKVEGLFLRRRPDVEPPPGAAAVWLVMLKTNRRPRLAERLTLTTPSREPREAHLTLLSRDRQSGEWLAALSGPDASPDARATLQRLGAAPLPPYILAARKARRDEAPDEADRRWYQTVFNDPATCDEQGGAVAAPTAGLHFTPGLLDALDRAGVVRSDLVLHVGAGTFRPVESETVEAHPMHSERCEVPRRALAALDRARRHGRLRLAVGTTTARALESVPAGQYDDWTGETDLLITPGYAWRRIDALLTNFHLPRSTLLAMVASLFPAGVADLLYVYREAVQREYRFYSYGDAMLILP